MDKGEGNMIYLDYAANTPVRKEVLDTFVTVSREYIANPNSPHSQGKLAKNKLEECTAQIKELLHASDYEVVYTSGASESNNLAIKGAAKKNRSFGKHIITTYLEHSSVNGAMEYLTGEGFEVDYVDITKDGLVDPEHFRELLRRDTVLVSICHVDSEIGLRQNIAQIGELLLSRPNCCFHVDATQSVGKIPVSLENVDLLTFAPHKFYGLNGCGALLKKQSILLEPLIHGGISTTPYRSGTPAPGLIAATAKALELAAAGMDQNYLYAEELNKYLRDSLGRFPAVRFNSTGASVPFILNISIPGLNTGMLQAELDKQGVCLSTKSACCAPASVSRPVYALTRDKKAALATLRISLSHLTTREEIDIFLQKFSDCYNKLAKQR